MSIRILIWKSGSIEKNAFLKPQRRREKITTDSKGSQRSEEGANILPLLHFDKANALELSITKRFFPPQLVSCALTPDGRPEVPCSPTMRILFASLST